MSEPIKTAVLAVDNVQTCRVTEDDERVLQIHVEALFESSEAEERIHELGMLKRSIASAVEIDTGIEIEEQMICVVEVEPDSFAANASEGRIKIVEVFHTESPRVASSVRLRHLQETYQGTFEGGADPALCVFRAFADAFHQMSIGVVDLEYIQVLDTALPQDRVVLLKVRYSCGQEKPDMLLGAAEVRGDLATAVVKAVLHAMNRRVALQLMS